MREILPDAGTEADWIFHNVGDRNPTLSQPQHQRAIPQMKRIAGFSQSKDFLVAFNFPRGRSEGRGRTKKINVEDWLEARRGRSTASRRPKTHPLHLFQHSAKRRDPNPIVSGAASAPFPLSGA